MMELKIREKCPKLVDTIPISGIMIVSKQEKQLNREIGKLLQKVELPATAGLPDYQTLTFSEFLTDKMLVVFAIRTGIPYPLFDLIRDAGPFSDSDWTSILDISSKTLNRYKAENRDFKTLLAGKIMEMAEVTSVGLEVFGDLDHFRQWLNTPSFALGNLTPLDLLKDSYGKELVLTELHHIHHGIFV